MIVGVISDTHGYLDPLVSSMFQGVQHIIHGGDVGPRRVLNDLEKIAPVTAVAGNTDDPAMGYPVTQLVELGGRRLLAQHIVNPHHLSDPLLDRMARDRPDVLVFGHSHKPFAEHIGSTLFLNPGYAGKNRFGMKRTVALLYLEQEIRWEYLPLD